VGFNLEATASIMTNKWLNLPNSAGYFKQRKPTIFGKDNLQMAVWISTGIKDKH
jgi:hypothetical protein